MSDDGSITAIAASNCAASPDEAEEPGSFKKIGVTPQQLLEAVPAVGEAPEAVERYLEGARQA